MPPLVAFHTHRSRQVLRRWDHLVITGRGERDLRLETYSLHRRFNQLPSRQ